MDLSFLACSCSTSTKTLKRFGLILYSCSGSVSLTGFCLNKEKNHRFRFRMHNRKHCTGTTPPMNIQWTSAPTNFSKILHQKSQWPSAPPPFTTPKLIPFLSKYTPIQPLTIAKLKRIPKNQQNHNFSTIFQLSLLVITALNTKLDGIGSYRLTFHF